MERRRVTVTASGLTKSFGAVAAVSDLSFEVGPGITGFLGPNGAGKTTALRMILDLISPDSGHATIGGTRYRDLPRPTATVGAVLDSSSFHPGMTARDHLRTYAALGAYPRSRVDEVIALLDISGFADRRTGGFSTGMRQRLGLATALLGDPDVLLLDEPSNGLDPQGMAWLRSMLRGLAAEGRTVVISSHVLSEIEQIVDRVIVIDRGRLITAAGLSELQQSQRRTVRVRSAASPDLAEALRTSHPDADVVVQQQEDDSLLVTGLEPGQVSTTAAAEGIALTELGEVDGGLEQLFLHLTGDHR